MAAYGSVASTVKSQRTYAPDSMAIIPKQLPYNDCPERFWRLPVSPSVDFASRRAQHCLEITVPLTTKRRYSHNSNGGPKNWICPPLSRLSHAYVFKIFSSTTEFQVRHAPFLAILFPFSQKGHAMNRHSITPPLPARPQPIVPASTSIPPQPIPSMPATSHISAVPTPTPPPTPLPTASVRYYDSGAHLHDDERRARRLQLAVIYKNRSIQLDVGPEPIIAELLPDIARRLGALDPTIAHGGYHLITEEGIELSPSGTFAEQNVENHSELTLHPGVLEESTVVYDDIVEAVGDSVTRISKPWTKEHSMITSLLISGGMLLLGISMLATMPSTVINGALALGFGAVLLALSAILSSKDLPIQSLVIGILSAVFGGVGGYQVVAALYPQHSFYGTSLLACCGCLMAFGTIQTLLSGNAKPYSAIPIVIGAVIAIPTSLGIIFPSSLTTVWVGSVAFIAVIGNFLPWASLSLAQLSVDSPQKEADIFELPESIDPETTRERYRTGSTMLFIARIASAALLLLACPLLAAQSPPYAGIMLIAAFVSMLIGSRQIYSIREMIVTVGAAALGLILTCAVFANHHPAQAPVLTVTMIVGALVAVLITYLTRGESLFATRVADAVEVACILSILPLAYFAIVQ